MHAHNKPVQLRMMLFGPQAKATNDTEAKATNDTLLALRDSPQLFHYAT